MSRLSRRTFMQGAAATAVASSAGMTVAACEITQTNRNVLMLYIDDLRDWVGYMNTYPGVLTPNIDALMAQSISFDRAYCAVPTCPGSRASTAWGLSPLTTGVQTNTIADQYPLLNSDRKSLPEVFSDFGYTTYNRGKFFHNALPDRWDVTSPYLEINEMQVTGTPTFQETLFNFGTLASGEVHEDQLTADWFSTQLHQAQGPFFMGVGLFQPHVPWLLPQWAFDLYPLEGVMLPSATGCGPGDLDDVPAIGQDLAAQPRVFAKSQNDFINESGRAKEIVQAYLAAISHTDTMIGQVMNALADSGHDQDTVVALVSDHGYHLGEKLHWRKSTLWEQATRVPLLLRVPGAVPHVISHPVSTIDLAPTLLQAGGNQEYAGFEGSSLLTADSAYFDANPPVTHWQNNVSVRWQSWRYIRYHDGTEELYDQASDPYECTNLAGLTEHQAQKSQLAAFLP